MIEETKLKYLGRYTSITTLLCMIESKKLFLSDPRNWPDKTDAYILNLYAKKTNEKVRALCFFGKYQRNNYWELYAKYGCMIEFDKEILFKSIKNNNNFDFKKVEYIKPKFLKRFKENLPFVKQDIYKDEREYRLVWKGNNENDAVFDFDLKAIRKITISDDIDEKLKEYLIKIIRKIANGMLDKLEIAHSNLFENKILIEKLTPKQKGE